MNEFLLVLAIGLLAFLLTYLGAPAAERVEASARVTGGMLQFAAGIITALVAFSLMPRNQPLQLRLILVALASGFLITVVIQGMIPEANREGEPRLAGVLYMGGLSLYALMSLALR